MYLRRGRLARPQTPQASLHLLWWMSIFLFSLWYFPFTATSGHVGFMADDALYLLMADYFSPAHAYDSVVHYVHDISHLPPLYPALLGVAGAGSEQIDIAHFVQTTMQIAGLPILGLIALRVTQNRIAALGIMWLFALAPASFLFSTEIWSEFAYILLSYAALLLALHAREIPAWWWPCVILAGLSSITRGVGLVLVLAIAAALLMRRTPGRFLLIPLAFAPLAVVEFLDLGGGSNYAEVMLTRYANLVAIADSLTENLAAAWAGWCSVFSLNSGTSVQLISIVMLPGISYAWWSRLKSAEPDALYALGYFLLLIVWPFPNVAYRLNYPLAPLLVIFACVGWATIFRVASASLRRWIPALPVLILMVPAAIDTGRMAWRFLGVTPPTDVAAFRASRYWLNATDDMAAARDIRAKQGMIATMREARDAVPPVDCIYALDPQAVMFYSRRISFPPGTAAAREQEPSCRFHLLISDRKIHDAYESLWYPYEVVTQVKVGDGVAGILVRYPE